MAKQEMEIGPAGKTVIENMLRLRKAAGLTLNQLSERTENAGRKLSPDALSLIATGKRRVDVDDLTVLAKALAVSPQDLLGGVVVTPAPARLERLEVLLELVEEERGRFTRGND